MSYHHSSPKTPRGQSTYSVYAQNAVFHDPVGIAEGIGAIREQFNGLAKVRALHNDDTLLG